MTPTSDSTTPSIPKLRDDGSNWADYKPRVRQAMGSKGLWMHVEGTATKPKPYVIINAIPVLSDGKTRATEEQIETRETRMMDFENREYLVQHFILSTMLTHLGAAIKYLQTAKEMWDAIKADTTTKSMLYLIDAEDQLASRHLNDSNDP